MTVHHNVRTTTAGTTTVPKIRRSGGSAARRWVGPAAMVAVAVTALAGVYALRSTDDTPPVRPVTGSAVNGGFEPLIGPEERAIINGEFPPLVPRSVAISTGMEPLIGAEERAIIDGEYPRLPAIDLCAMQKPC